MLESLDKNKDPRDLIREKMRISGVLNVCPKCHGAKILPNKKLCSYCSGEGEVLTL